MSPLKGAFLSQLRCLLASHSPHKRRRSHNKLSGQLVAYSEQLEQRQMLVSQIPTQLIVNSSQTPITVQWVQPSNDPADSFNVTIKRTDLVSGGQQTVVFDPAIAKTVNAGMTETYTISQSLATGSYSVSVSARGNDSSVSASASTAFSLSQVAPLMLSVSGKQFSSIPATRPTVGKSVTLAWTVLPGVNDYYVWIGRKNGSTYTQITDTALPNVRGGVCELNLTNGEYQVKVRDLNRTPEMWSSIVDFEVTGSQLTSPVITSTSTVLGQGSVLSWNRVPNAVRYDVEVTNTATSQVTTSRVARAEYSANFLPVGSYSARVRAFTAADRASSWSAPVPFTISASSYKPAFTASPSGSQVNGVTILEWAPIGWAKEYEVTVQQINGVTTTVKLRERVRSPRFAFPLLAAGTWSATVKAFDKSDSAGTNQTSSTANFVVSTTTYQPSPPALAYTFDGAQINWDRVAGAVRYDVVMHRNAGSGFTAQQFLVQQSTQTESFRLDSRFVEGASYSATIRPILMGGELGVASSALTFTLAANPSIVVRLSSNTDSRRPRIEWTEIPAATGYRIRIINSATPTANEVDVSGLTRPWFQPEASLPAGTYKARIDATLPGGASSIGTSAEFVTSVAPVTTGQSNISIALVNQQATVGWNSTAVGIYEVRLVGAAQPDRDVVREQAYFGSGSAAAKSYAIRSGFAPGLYRIDVGRRANSTSPVNWGTGPLFYFDGNSINPLQANGTVAVPPPANVTGPFKGDFDGDGDADIVRRAASNGRVVVSINAFASLEPATWNASGAGNYTDFVSGSATSSILVGDFNADGRDDLIQPDMNTGVWSVMRANPAAAFDKVEIPVSGLINPDLPTLSWNSQSNVLSWKPIAAANSTADRTYELKIVSHGNSTGYARVVRTIYRRIADNSSSDLTETLSTLSAGEYTVFSRTQVDGRTSQWSEGFAISVPVSNPVAGASAWTNPLVGDFNGDRRDDIAVFDTVRQQWSVALSSGTAFERSIWSSLSGTSGSTSLHTVLDVNGDGREDLVYRNATGDSWTVGLSTGTSFLMQNWAAPAFLAGVAAGSSLRVADMDRDGREDLIAPTSSGFQVAFSRAGFLATDSNGTTWQPVVMPSNSEAVDANGDGRIDVVGFDAAGKSFVALSSASGFGAGSNWEVNSTTPWFVGLEDNGIIVADYQYRTRKVQAAFDFVNSTIEFEGYRGIKKGADGTLASRSGNAWDQANLLGTQINSGSLTKVQYVTGKMKLTSAQINAWLTTTVASSTYFTRAGLNPTVDSGNIEFDHAWLQAWLPTATGMGWVDLNPSLKASRSATPETVSNLFSADDLKAYLTPISRSFTASFAAVADASVTPPVYQAPSIPNGIQFASGGGVLVSNGGWQTLAGVPDYKLQTSHASPTTMFVGDTAVNGTLSAAITAQRFDPIAQSPLQNYRVFWRAADGTEIGFESFAVGGSEALTQRVYQRVGDTETLPTNILESTTTGDPAFSPPAVTDLQNCHVQFTLSGTTLTVFAQWQTIGTNVLQAKKFVATVAPRQGSGRFGIVTKGSGHHFLDDISLTGTDIPAERPLAWTLTQKLNSPNAADRTSVESIGQTRSIIQNNSVTPVSLTAAGSPESWWMENDYQTATISFVDLNGVPVAYSQGSQSDVPSRLSNLVRRQLVVRVETKPATETQIAGTYATLLLDGMTLVTTTAQANAGNLQLKVEIQSSSSATADTQFYKLKTDSTSQLQLRAGQYSASDQAWASDQLAAAYDGLPTTVDASGAMILSSDNQKIVIEKLLAYSTIRLLTSGEQSEDDIAKLTEAIIVRPGVTSGLITASSYLVQKDSVYFIRPKDMTIDFPVGRMFFAPRADGDTVQTDELQQARARLALVELSAHEQDLLAELSDKPALSALQVLSVASANGAVVRRMMKNADGTYVDLWSPGTAANTDLSTFLSFGSSTHQAASFTLVKQQLDGGGVVTVASTMQSFADWTGFAWLHEKLQSDAQGTLIYRYPVVESLMKSNVDGLLLHGGVVDSKVATMSSDFSQLRDTGVTPDPNQGVLRRSDTDFSISIPGLSVPFTRTWTSERSDSSTGMRIVDGTESSGFGVDWSQPFSQRLEIVTMTANTVYTVKKKRWWGGTYTVPVQNNMDRLGEAALINWLRADGSQGVFAANGQKVVGTNGISVSADYDSPLNMPGVTIRRFDGAAAGLFGAYYEVIHADGAVYRFENFNEIGDRQSGLTSALLISMKDRFENEIKIIRDATNRSRITSITSGTGTTLATFTYSTPLLPADARIQRIVVKAAATGAAPTAGVTGDRIWDYSYDSAKRLIDVNVSEATGTGDSMQPTSTISRFAYSWYDRVSTGTAAVRADRLEGFMKTAVGLGGAATDNGASYASTYQYFGNGRLRRVQDAQGRESRFLYNEYAGVSSVVDAAGVMSTTQFNDLGDMVVSIQPSGERVLYKMATNVRQMASTISTNGRSESWQYDAKGNVIRHQDAVGIAQELTYHPIHNQVLTVTEISTPGTRRVVTYNVYYTTDDAATKSKKGALKSTKDALNNTTLYKYTPQGLIAEISSPRGHSTVFDAAGYDTFGNPLRVDYLEKIGTTVTTQSSSESLFDNTGRLDQVKEYGRSTQRDRVTKYTWDALGRLLETLAPNPYDSSATAVKVRTQYIYGPSGLLDRRIDPDGSVWRTEYDNTGRPLREYRPDGTFTEVQYNTNGTVAVSIDPNGNKTRFVYDSLNRLVQALLPDGTGKSYVYDAKGDLIREIDPRGLVTSHEYDSAGRLAKTIDADGKQTTFGYDYWGNQTTVTTEKGVITNLFNAQHQMIQTLYDTLATASGTTVRTKVRVDRFFYDANGNQDRVDSIDLRVDSVLMPAALIASLTNSTVTREEADSVAASRKRSTSTVFDYRGTAVVSVNAAENSSSTVLNAARQTASVTDVRGAITQFGYDLAGGLQYESLPLAETGDTTSLARVYRRDLMGRVTETRETAYAIVASTTNLIANAATGEQSMVSGSAAARVSRTSYDLMGHVVASQDALGFMTRVTYDPAGNVIESIDASRRSRLTILDNMDRVVKEVLPPVLVVQPSTAVSVASTWEFPMTKTAYDADGNVVSSTDVSGRTTTFQYDALNRMIVKTAPPVLTDVSGVQQNVSPVWQWTYDALGNVTSETDPLLRVSSSTYDFFGRVLSRTLPDPDGTGPLLAATTVFTYDAFGNLLTVLEQGDPSTTTDDRITVHEYNALNQKIRTTLPDPDGPTNGTLGLLSSPVLTWTYDDAGNVLTEVDPLLRTTTYTWNQRNQLTKKELPAVANAGPGGSIPTFLSTYDVFGSTISSTDALGRITTFDHDEAGRTILTVSPHPDGGSLTGLRSFSTVTEYDASGNVLRAVDHLGRVSTSAYDGLNRVIRSTKPDADVTDSELPGMESISYDLNGNVARSMDALGHVTRFEYDAANRSVLTAVQDTNGWATTQTWYDIVGNVTRSFDAANRATVFRYDAWNRPTQVRLPSTTSDPAAGPATTTEYDQWGNVKKVTGPRGGMSESTYDNLNRLTRQLSPTPLSGATRPETVFVYDVAGNVDRQQVLVSRDGTTEVWTETRTFRDALNRVIKVSIRPERDIPDGQTPTVETVTYNRYDLLGNVVMTIDALSRDTTFEYDRLNRLVAQTDPAPVNGSIRPVTRFLYDNSGNMEATIDTLGRITSSTFDALGRRLSSTSPDPDGLQGPLPAPSTSFEYDLIGNLLSTTDHLGRQTVSVYDVRNRVIGVTQPDADLYDNLAAATVSTVYDVVGNRIQETDALGNVTDYQYDALNRLIQTTLPDAVGNDRLDRPILTFGYDLSGNLIALTDAAGRVSTIEYDPLNRKFRERTADPDGISRGNAPLTTVYTYDGLSNVLTTNSYRTSTIGRVTTNEYDYLNRLTKVTSPIPAALAAQLITIYAYDAVGNKKESYQASSSNPAGRNGSSFLYDNLNRLIRVTNQNPDTGLLNTSVYTSWTYDLAGRVLSEKDELNRTTSYFYDELDRQFKVIGADPDSSSDATPDKIAAETRLTYDAAGNLESSRTRRNVDPLGTSASSKDVFLSTVNQYDRVDRLVTTIDANGGSTQYRYDNNGHRIALTDASFNTSRWVFDQQGKVIAETDANGFSSVPEYDIVGNVVAVTDRRGYRTQFVRDDLDRVIYEQWLKPNGTGSSLMTEFRNTYDPYGRQTVAEQWDMTTGSAVLVSKSTRTIDDLDRLLTTDGGTTPGQSLAKLTFQYDAFGNRTSRQQQTGTGTSQLIVTTAYSNYDFLNRLTKLNQTVTGTFANWQNKSVELTYRSDDSISTIKRYSDATWTSLVVQTSYGQDGAGRLTSQVHSKLVASTLTPVVSYAYQYFADDKLLSEVSSVPSLNFNNVTDTFGYDANGQLTTAAKSSGVEAYQYDSTGNRVSAGRAASRGNRVLNDGNYAFTYDAEGQVIKRQRVVVAQGSDTLQEYTEFTWDNRGQMTKVEFFSSSSLLTKRVEHVYDVDGNRISKKVTTIGSSTAVTIENYVYDGQQLVATLSSSGTIMHEYFDGESLDQVFADQSSVSGVLWPLEDRAGAARDILSTAGTVVDHRLMNSFGTVASQTNSAIKYEQFFSGLLWDTDSQLYYARARWYEPVSGKFLSEDPLGFDGGDNNLSRYSANDPVNNVDRSGLSWLSHGLDQVGNAFADVGDFFGDQWDNGNIQKGLLVAGTLASGGVLGFGLASGSLLGTSLLATSLGFASGVANSYEVFSGNRIGDGTFTRVLGAAAAVTGGFYAPGVSNFGTAGRTISGASGLVSGYEIATGDIIGDGTLSSLFHVTNLGVNHASVFSNADASPSQRFGVGLNLAVGTASVFSSGDPQLQHSLRALSIAGGVWNTTTTAFAAAQQFKATIHVVNAAKQPNRNALIGKDSRGEDPAGTSARSTARDGRIRLVSGQENAPLSSSERFWIHRDRIEAEAKAAEQAGDLETAKRLRFSISKESYDPEPRPNTLAILSDDEPITSRAPMIDDLPAYQAPSDFWDFSDSIGMDFTGFAEGYARSLNPWSENAQAPVDDFDRFLQFGQETSITVGAGALTTLGAIYAAPYAIAGASSAASSFGSMSVYAQTQLAAGVTGTSTFIAANGPRIAAFASDKISRLNVIAQTAANWFNSRPFVRERVLEAVEGYAESGSTEGAVGNAIVGGTIDVAPGMMSGAWRSLNGYIKNFTGTGHSFTTMSLFPGAVPSIPKAQMPSAPRFSGGSPVLAERTHYTSALDMLIVMMKSSAKNTLGTTHVYVNHGQHDTSNRQQVRYNQQKSVLPVDHVRLFQTAVPHINPKDSSVSYYSKDAAGNYHWFQSNGNGTEFHWSGQTNGSTKTGEPRTIEVPKQLKDKLDARK